MAPLEGADRGPVMHLQLALALQVVWTGICHTAIQNYPAAWGHYDVCKSQVYSDEGLTWDYMACQPEAADMTQFLKVTLDPPNITCGDPPETYCALLVASDWRSVMNPGWMSVWHRVIKDSARTNALLGAFESSLRKQRDIFRKK